MWGMVGVHEFGCLYFVNMLIKNRMLSTSIITDCEGQGDNGDASTGQGFSQRIDPAAGDAVQGRC
ncbi:MAG: hypothetical protein KDJ16_02140, partial [Hyphomicrobiales bacterium]|nr:hypothetical protein [Hyphomicrobiales bacterium]